MSNRTRIGVLVAFVAVAALAFFALKGGDSDSDSAAGEGATSHLKATTPATHVVRGIVVVSKDGAVGGVKTIEARSGDRIVISVTSTDVSGEVHLHGFDIHRDLAPGKAVEFSVPASATSVAKGQGVFEMEMEATATHIAKVHVSP
jgi:heme/copper-type cytochrome/quinol oxidase subunit 2